MPIYCGQFWEWSSKECKNEIILPKPCVSTRNIIFPTPQICGWFGILTGKIHAWKNQLLNSQLSLRAGIFFWRGSLAAAEHLSGCTWWLRGRKGSGLISLIPPLRYPGLRSATTKPRAQITRHGIRSTQLVCEWRRGSQTAIMDKNDTCLNSTIGTGPIFSKNTQYFSTYLSKFGCQWWKYGRVR